MMNKAIKSLERGRETASPSLPSPCNHRQVMASQGERTLQVNIQIQDCCVLPCKVVRDQHYCRRPADARHLQAESIPRGTTHRTDYEVLFMCAMITIATNARAAQTCHLYDTQTQTQSHVSFRCGPTTAPRRALVVSVIKRRVNPSRTQTSRYVH